MKTIHKYLISNDTKVDLPQGAEVLHANHRQGNLYIWALVETTEPIKVSRRFMTFRTNDSMPMGLNYKYIGTSKMISDLMIFHTFEVI